jgi:hypothetical protein
MPSTMPSDDQTRIELLLRQRDLITVYGRAISYVLGTDGDPSRFGHTVGLTEHGDGYPELLIAGLSPVITQILLNDLSERVLTHGERFTHGQTITDLITDYPAVIINGPHTDTLHPGTLIGHYGTGKFTLQQIVWPDPDGRFPWDDGYRYPATVQPTLGRP